MGSDLSLALQLQEVDRRIDVLTREIDGLPKEIASIEATLASHKDELAQKRARLDDNAKEHRSLEGQVSDCNQKISKLLEQINSAKTNEQYRAFQHEIQFCRDKIDEVEEHILDRMEQAEFLEASVAKAEADLEIETAKVAEEVELTKERIAADEQERAKRREDRKAVVARIGAGTLRIYERVRKARGISAAPVNGESCGACHVRLRPKVLQDLRQLEEGVLTCESCGLIVYFPAPSEDEGEDEGPVGIAS